ncbi:heme-binding protein [Myxococcota bacterium]|nr:heme-binding protein [Myxococcota bacterium]
MKASIERPHITGEAALRICDAALATARSEGQAVVVAVFDPSGGLVAFVAEQGAPRISHAVARDKAFTAAMTGMSSAAWKQLMDQMPANEREIVLRAEGYVGTEGGLPILESGRLIGGVGVSGAATGTDDARLAAAGLAVLA